MRPASVRSFVRSLSLLALASVLACAAAEPIAGQLADVSEAGLRDASGEDLYRAACANCHGADGSGVSAALLAFEEAVPDFTDCSFASREPDADWVGVAHEGGPARGFSPMMPAFGEILSPEQLQRVMDYVRSFCGDDGWPRGELNFPRALLTEKAYPEDEYVFESDGTLEGDGVVSNQIVYERRFGARSQLEVVVPFAFREGLSDEDTPEAEPEWSAGLGDIVLGVKRDMFHSASAGSIVSLGAEVKLPTGDESEGFGGGTTVFETFVSYGQTLTAGAFFQGQGVLEFPTESDAADEAVWRGGIGRTFTDGRWGRAWSPIVEVQGSRELESGAETSWDFVPQLQVTLNTRQHVQLNVGALIPMTDGDTRSTRWLAYLLWDWFDGGFFEGW